MNKTAIAILATALMLPLSAGCNRKDEKAGYPGQPSGKQTQQPAPPQILQPDARRNESSPPGPPEHKTAADRRLLRNAGALGDLASAFCDASVKADAKARTAMFSDEFIVYAGLGEKIAGKLQPDELKSMFRTTRMAMLKDMKAGRKTPVRECEILVAAKMKCNEAVTDIMNRAAIEDLSEDRLMYALRQTKTQDCGAFEIREISNSGIEYSRFIAGTGGEKWNILIAVRPD